MPILNRTFCFLAALTAIAIWRCTPTAQAAETLVPASVFATEDTNLVVTVWASSPALKNPTNMDIDQYGRIWVAEGVNYRKHYNRQPEGDRIMVLQDTDGDGKADKSWVFVQEPFLRAPMGIAVIDNRIVVSMSPELIVYTDVDRNGRFDPAIDKREVLLTGFNGRIHDHTIHSVTVGPDGQWYWNSGNCGAVITDRSGKTFRIGSSYDPYYGNKPAGDLGWDPREVAGQKSDDGHVYVGGFAARMNPDGSGMNIIGHNFRNSYEQAVTSFGDVFQSDNDDPPACRTAFLMEWGNAGYSSFDGKRSWRADRRPGQNVPTAEWRQEDPGTMPAGDVYGSGSPTGMAFIEDSALGKSSRGMLLSCEPGRNVVFGYFPKPDGAGFELKKFNFLTSNKMGKFAGGDYNGGDKSVSGELPTLFRPSDVTVGADGAIYVADFFDPRIGGHNDMDESLSGAIYRIAPQDFKPINPKMDLTTLDGALAALKSPAVNVRGAAFSAIKAHGPKAVKQVTKLLSDENPYVRARAIWLLSQLGHEGAAKVEPLVRSSDTQARLVAFRAMRRQTESQGDHSKLIALCEAAASEPSPALRREAAIALRDTPFALSRKAMLSLVKSYDGHDRWMLEAIGIGATGNEAALYSALALDSDPLQWTPANASLAWRLHPPNSAQAFRGRALAPLLPASERKAAITALAYIGTSESVQGILDAAAGEGGAAKLEAVWWLLNRKDSVWKPFALNPELKRRRIYDPDEIEIASSTMPQATQTNTLTIAEVLSLRGNIARGSDLTGRCVMCHRINGAGNDVGPDITAFGRSQTLEVIAQSIILPSADIAHGYGAHEIITKDGIHIEGIIISDSDPVVLMSAGGLTQMIPSDRIATKLPLGRSLMWTPAALGLTPQDTADLIAFLKSI